MAINKVVYGTTVLVDLTSDTVDASHLAKGYTAHDAGGNLIVGTLEQQGSDNLLSGVTPSLLNGTTQSGKTYVIPKYSGYGIELIEYQLDIPKLTSDAVYNILMYGKTEANYRSVFAELHFQKPDGEASSVSTQLLFGATGDAKGGSFKLASGTKPTKLVIKDANDSSKLPSSISGITLVVLDA